MVALAACLQSRKDPDVCSDRFLRAGKVCGGQKPPIRLHEAEIWLSPAYREMVSL